MFSTLCVAFAVAAVNLRWTEAACTSTKAFPSTNIPGGEYVDRRTVADCQNACNAKAGCVSFDFNPANQWCWLLSTQSGKQSSADIDHYDCNDGSGGGGSTEGRDLTISISDTSAFQTNYKGGSVTDFWSLSNGVTWATTLPAFTFRFSLLSQIQSINSIRFTSSSNMAYFKVVYKNRNDQTVTIGPIYPNQNTFTVNNADGVRGDAIFYVTPVDFRQNVSISGLEVKSCAFSNIPIIGGLACLAQSILELGLQIVSLGFIEVRSGKIYFSAAADLPYIDLDLNRLGIGTSDFSKVTFGQNTNFNLVVVKVWKGGVPVPVIRKDGIQSDTFDYNQAGVVFAHTSSQFVRGDRIRTILVPNLVETGDTQFTVRFTKYGVWIF